ncbi:hypothetical protein SAMN04488057_11430 [Cyclobacterium lianum]|uniref:Complex I intermediate-associated protein 30 (CIA30) n=2 Tax=Cyclobacterium lianum TaxID=388280 RepID=A0A1M7Q547_9BACT|nr:hypothetical protein SAMN04488057_11430 [Cyclobacterium lianum]
MNYCFIHFDPLEIRALFKGIYKSETMIHSRFLISGLLPVLMSVSAPLAWGQSGASLLFREDFKEIPAATPVTEDHLVNEELELHLYGDAKNQLKKSNHPEIPNDPFYLWSGTCEGTWAMALSWKKGGIDLRNGGKIRFRSRQSGFHRLRMILELDAGNWVISEDEVGETPDWVVSEFEIGEMTWRELNIGRIVEGKPVANPDFSKVSKIGFTDLMAGGGTPASSRLDWVAVYKGD